MYIITDKQGVIIKISPTIGYQDNGNPLVDEGRSAIAAILVGAVSGDIVVPEGVGEYTHCWVDGEFTRNPAYTPPPPSEQDQLAALAALAVDTAYRLTLMGLGV